MPDRIQPSINERAFACPHCGAFTTQTWYQGHAQYIRDEKGKASLPMIPDAELLNDIRKQHAASGENRVNLLVWAEKIVAGAPFLSSERTTVDFTAGNLFLTRCYHCEGLAIWVHDRLLYPPTCTGAAPNPDLPPDVIVDYEEARSILDLSPRGAAALLRLCIQKLCVFLGEKGKRIDDDIASLVVKGLDPLVQKSLDVVRVIGNEAVHPGEMDLKDDRDTAAALFELVNAIAAQMISHPKNVDAMYKKLPPEKRAAIEARDAKAKGGS